MKGLLKLAKSILGFGFRPILKVAAWTGRNAAYIAAVNVFLAIFFIVAWPVGVALSQGGHDIIGRVLIFLGGIAGVIVATTLSGAISLVAGWVVGLATLVGVPLGEAGEAWREVGQHLGYQEKQHGPEKNIRFFDRPKEAILGAMRGSQVPAIYLTMGTFYLLVSPTKIMLGLIFIGGVAGAGIIWAMKNRRRKTGGFMDLLIVLTTITVVAVVVMGVMSQVAPLTYAAIMEGTRVDQGIAVVITTFTGGTPLNADGTPAPSPGVLATVLAVALIVGLVMAAMYSAYAIIKLFTNPPEGEVAEEEERARAEGRAPKPIAHANRSRAAFWALTLLVAATVLICLPIFGVRAVKATGRAIGEALEEVDWSEVRTEVERQQAERERLRTPVVEVRYVDHTPYVPPTSDERQERRRARRTARRDADDAADQRGAARIRASLQENFGP